ncbi:MAG: CtsR family transcriptional regulator [Clostridia bacterium]|nr:CtsR family transcriptional regulator [Clostridia bacterium]
MKISDIIENVLKELIEETDGEARFQRNELASRLNCVPSQINYVINSRFTNAHGYIVESQRGGGGSITIRRVSTGNSGYIMHIVSGMGDAISQQSAFAFIRNFLDYGIISEREAKLMNGAVSNSVLRRIEQPVQDILRASIMKNMLLSLA